MLKTKIIIFSVLTICLFIFYQSFKANSNQEYNLCLNNTYTLYKAKFMSNDGRIMDPDKNNISTSEGQSYIMLRSLTIGDKQTFDLTYKWAKNNLQRKDKLFAWLWGEDKNGQYRILDENSASDADIDIAFALLLAYEKWNNYEHLQEALPIIRAIWDKETKKIGSKIILTPGAQQTLDEKIEINPSYFSPYAFRFFQKYDELHDWNYLIDSSYYYLDKVTQKTSTHLPPNWFLLAKNGEDYNIVLEDSERSDFSYDAVRVFFRIYLDYLRTGDKRALPILEKSKFFLNEWKSTKKYYTNYKANGELRDKVQYIGSIAIITPVLYLYDSDFATEIYNTKIDPYLENKTYWQNNSDYYGKNLLWFGCYLYNKDSDEFKEMHKKRISGY